MKIYGGIDPGKEGAVAMVDDAGKTVQYYAFPKIGNEVDIQGLTEILIALKELNLTHLVLENVHSIAGSSAKSNFSFGHTNGIIEGVLVALKIPYTKVQPKAWQKEMFNGIPVQQKDGKNDTKLMSLLASKRLFPEEKFLATSRSKVPHDGITDAVLMSEYCRRKFK
jgi:hypothetical protein